jgi:hypothetical protein
MAKNLHYIWLKLVLNDKVVLNDYDSWPQTAQLQYANIMSWATKGTL